MAASSEPDRASSKDRPRAFLPEPRRHWYILATSAELSDRPLARRLFGKPVVLFRATGGKPSALVDRCPHRNVPLSLGQLSNGRLACAYHGWEFEGDGSCAKVPCLTGELSGRGKDAEAFATIEQQGFIWVYGEAGPAPESLPHRFEKMDDPAYTTVSRSVRAEASLYSALENALDVPHTTFLHRGLFRSESRGIAITANVSRGADRVAVEYIGEPRPSGIVGKLLSPSGGMVKHIDRFILPSIAQVEYGIGTENHFLVDSVMTPVDAFVTDIYAVVSYRLRMFQGALRPLLEPLALRIFGQDAVMLKRQTNTILEFGAEQFMSTEIDVMSSHMRRLLRASELGEVVPPHEDVVTLLV